MNENPYRILDEVLMLFSQSEGSALVHIKKFDIPKLLLEKGIIIDVFYMEQILDKLEKEHYLYKGGLVVVKHLPNGKEYDNMYNLTFEGLLLLNSGGYRAKMKREQSSVLLNWVLSLSIAVGTVLAGIYGLMEIVRVVYRHYYHN